MNDVIKVFTDCGFRVCAVYGILGSHKAARLVVEEVENRLLKDLSELFGVFTHFNTDRLATVVNITTGKAISLVERVNLIDNTVTVYKPSDRPLNGEVTTEHLKFSKIYAVSGGKDYLTTLFHCYE